MTAKAGGRAALILGLCSLSAVVAAAEREPIRLVYSADAGCPSSKDFEAAVLERSSRARPAGKREIAREYRVAVRKQEGKSIARLEFAARGGGTVTREVAADQCAEAVRAIALVTALAFDAGATAGAGGQGSAADAGAGGELAAGDAERGQPPSTAATEPATGAEAATSRTAPKKPSVDAAVRKRAAPARPDAQREPARDREPMGSRAAASEGPEFELGARATLTYAKAPSVLPGAELFALMAGPRLTWLLQVGLAGERGARFEKGPGEARFSFVGGRLEGCFWGVAPAEPLELRPCAMFEAGAVIAEGFIEEPRTVVDPWFALGLNARLSADLGWATAVLEAGPSFPLTSRDSVVFGSVENPRQEVHQVPPIGAFASLGLSFAVR